MAVPGRFDENMRIIWAIAAKDIVDAIRNKTTISVFLGVAVLMLSSQALPWITRLSSVHRVAVYDEGESRLMGELERDPGLRVINASSQKEMEEMLRESAGTMLGLILPGDFDQALNSNHSPELDGYFVHWVSTADASEARAFFEARFTELTGQPVHIDIEGNTLYPHPDSDGQPLMVAMTLLLAIVTISGFLVPYLMIDEKDARTLDALLVSPASIKQVIVGKAIAGMVYGLVAAGVVLVFNRVFVVHWGLAAVATVCGTLFAVGVGLLLGSVFDNPQNMNLCAGVVFIVLLMPVFLDMTAPNLPESVTTLMPWTPSAAMAKVFRISFSNNVPMGQLLVNLGIVMGSAALILVVVFSIVRRSDR